MHQVRFETVRDLSRITGADPVRTGLSVTWRLLNPLLIVFNNVNLSCITLLSLGTRSYCAGADAELKDFSPVQRESFPVSRRLQGFLLPLLGEICCRHYLAVPRLLPLVNPSGRATGSSLYRSTGRFTYILLVYNQAANRVDAPDR